MTTKQNDMPDELWFDISDKDDWVPYDGPWRPDCVRYVRADKPADNGGECIRCKGTGIVECTTSPVDYDMNEPPPKNEVCICRKIAAPHPPEATPCPDCMSCSGNGMDCVGDGFCKGTEVSGEVDLNDINKALLNAADALSLAVSEVRQDTSIRGKADYWTYKDALEAIRRKIEALRPFLPAEK